MSGSITSGIDYSVLFPTTAGTGATSSLLGALYGTGGGTTSSPTAALQALQTAQRDQTKDIATTASQPQIARDIAAFQAAVANAKTPADLLANPTALKVLLTANGLSSDVAYPALAQKVLLSDPSNANSLVNQINSTDATWLPVVQTYQFATKGLAALQNPTAMAAITSGYAEISWRQSLDATTPGLSNALSFLQKASTMTSANQILGDPVIRDVVTTALNIPLQIAYQDSTAQQNAITSQLDISRLQDPKFVQSLAQEYLLNKAQAAQTSGTTPSLDSLAVQAAGLVV
ncbi:MAG: DUF1217 domain-containing protein [Rhodospirillales bacterium]|nr:DUF1217 domain-containing protein [Rhodospirillales bacterium]MDE2199174.1 DUF1217 domain-containing protein [Rhodospirillales bacterium]MDE2574534.1 DUF1217 domain-containing protein [Rhodospirillales bacterium]